MAFSGLQIHNVTLQAPTRTVANPAVTVGYANESTNVMARVDSIMPQYLFSVMGSFPKASAMAFMDSSETIAEGYRLIDTSDSNKTYQVVKVNKVPGLNGVHHIEAILEEALLV